MTRGGVLHNVSRVTKPRRTANSALVQTWVPRAVRVWVGREARREGLSVAAWLRTQLIKQTEIAK